MPPYDAYVICTAPRSGSTLLCKLLAATGVAGNPGSWFHEPSVEAWQARFGLSPAPGMAEQAVLASVFRAAIAKGSRGAGPFGLRLQRHSVDFFLGRLAALRPEIAGDAARIRAVFGKTRYIHLTRSDKLRQAVSYVKARQSGLWHAAPDGTELERLAPPREPAYDAAALMACFDEMTAYDRGWEGWFEREGIAPLRLSYDALAADPLAVLRATLTGLGLDPAAARGVVPAVAKLADSTNEAWAARLAADLAAR
ncbi:MAG: Stf0 family sulfotransferase [Pseudomonadota bacterium]